MMQNDEEPYKQPDAASDRQLWRRSCLMDAPEDEVARFLDLAAFADGLLEAEEHDRVAALLDDDPDAVADVRAARTPPTADPTSADLEKVVARACALLPEVDLSRGRVIAFVPRQRSRLVQHFAQWGSIAAAIAVASWLGFAMGSDTSLALSRPRQPSDTGTLPELFDPPSGFLRDLGEGLRT
jgi:anti-sigma factor RsiW